MRVTEYERHQLFVWFEGHLGPERPATMMNLLPPVDWGDLATESDIDRLRSDMQRTLGTWIFDSHAATIAAVGLLIGLAH